MQIKKHFLLSFYFYFFVLGIFGISSLEGAQWSQIRTIGNNSSFMPDVAVDRHGDAVAVFIHFDGSNQRIQTAIRPFEKHWTTLPQFLSTVGQDAENPKVAISPKGNATSVWKINSGSDFIVQAANLDFKNEQWETFDLTDPVNLSANPVVGVDSKGNSLVVWSIFDGTSYHIQSAIHKHGKPNDQWVMLNDIIVNGAFNLDLTLDVSGNAVLVWEGTVGFINVIQAATLSFGAHTWKQTSNISPSDLQSIDPKVDVDDAGNAIVIWSEGIGFDHIASAKLAFGSTSWINTSNPTSVNESSSPDIAVDPAGNAVAIWKRFVDFSTTVVEAATLPKGSLTWTPSVILSSSLLITEPGIVVDKQGNAVAIWSASGVLQEASLPFNGNWKPTISLTSSAIGVGGQRIAMSPCAFAVVVYTAQVFSLSQEVVQTLHSKGLFPPSPPKNLKGEVIKNEFLTQTEFAYKLTWESSDDLCVIQYFVRRNGKLIGIVPKKDPLQFIDHQRNKKIKDIYSVTAVKSDGTESSALTITLP